MADLGKNQKDDMLSISKPMAIKFPSFSDTCWILYHAGEQLFFHYLQ